MTGNIILILLGVSGFAAVVADILSGERADYHRVRKGGGK